jgi:hypothetical protein
MNETIMQSNISIDFNSKNNPKEPAKTTPINPQTTSQAKPIMPVAAKPTQSRPQHPRPAHRSQSQKSYAPAGQKITSEAFLRHRNKPTAAIIDDPKKLIKKDEVPVRVF